VIDPKDFLAEEEKYFFSLNKIAGQKIKDITVMVSYEFDDPVFSLHSIEFEDGTSLFVEGEHDIAYIYEYGPFGNTTKFVVSPKQLRPSIED
jgi:hypothetical protein